jgi:hypothetical protein
MVLQADMTEKLKLIAEFAGKESVCLEEIKMLRQRLNDNEMVSNKLREQIEVLKSDLASEDSKYKDLVVECHELASVNEELRRKINSKDIQQRSILIFSLSFLEFL